MPQDSVLKGRLEGFRPAELLQVMGLNASSGTLHLHSRDDRTGLIYVDAGSIVGSIELDTEALTLGHVLQQLNMATAAQLLATRLCTIARTRFWKSTGTRLWPLPACRRQRGKWRVYSNTRFNISGERSYRK